MRAAFFTLGCKVNQYETSVLSQLFEEHGFDIVKPSENADVYILNSCTVTAAGDQKSRQMLRRFKRQNPSAVVVLCGCFPQAFPQDAAAIGEADIVAGSRGRSQLLQLVLDKLSGGERVVQIAPHTDGEPFELMQANRFLGHTRAFVKIQDGCERFCSYCIIPTARGPVRSKTLEDLRAEVAALADAGHREVVLVGINLSCYGLDLGLRLLDAVRTVCSVTGMERVRLGSLEPELLTEKDIGELALLPAFCPQFHLSLQSGCDATLQRMNRHYDIAFYRDLVSRLRSAFENCAVTTDIMVGFPGESEAEFSQSMDFVREIGFAKMHVFRYSRRAGTAAADFPVQVDEAVKEERARRMSRAAAEGREAFLRTQLGREASVLLETQVAAGIWEGYGENYTPVRVAVESGVSGQLVSVRLTGLTDDGCVGDYCPTVQ